MKKLLCLMGLLCLSFTGITQPLTVGDTMPNFQLNNVLNYPSKIIKLSDFKNKLVIIDFWASWCSTCLEGFPKMNSLQSKYHNNIQFLAVNSKITRDSLDKIKFIINKIDSSLSNSFDIPVIAYDTVITKLFKFQMIPHYIWIDKNRVIIAITDKDQVVESNILKILKGQKVSLPLKNDY